MSIDPGCLFVVATPIGNLKDITTRASECLEEVALVAAEDTRRTRKLLSHLHVKKQVISCNEHNELIKSSMILDVLERGGSVALVSDAGTPGLSDPGARLVERIRQEHFRIVPIPGPSAVTAALSVSGFPGRSFHFAGFLPARTPERIRTLKKLASVETSLVFFEAPHRLLKSLKDILEVLGDRKIFLAREMTKAHETFILSHVSGLIEMLHGKDVRGEITLVVEGSKNVEETPYPEEPLKEVMPYLLGRECLSLKEASGLLSRLTGIGRGRIYKLALEIKRKQKDGE